MNSRIEAKHCVIATGGSVIYGKEAMEHLKQIGTVVYLQLSCEEINRRLGDLKQRGVALKDGQTLEELYAERVPLYEKYADVIQMCIRDSLFCLRAFRNDGALSRFYKTAYYQKPIQR